MIVRSMLFDKSFPITRDQYETGIAAMEDHRPGQRLRVFEALKAAGVPVILSPVFEGLPARDYPASHLADILVDPLHEVVPAREKVKA
jgi:hypothetical protein